MTHRTADHDTRIADHGLVVVAVAVALEGQLVEVDGVDGVDRVGPAKVIVEGDRQDRDPDGRDPVGVVDAGGRELRLEVGVLTNVN
jgi:hypothetical protein